MEWTETVTPPGTPRLDQALKQGFQRFPETAITLGGLKGSAMLPGDSYKGLPHKVLPHHTALMTSITMKALGAKKVPCHHTQAHQSGVIGA